MTKFVNRVLIAVVSFFPLLAALHSLEKDNKPARTSALLPPLPSESEPQPDEGNATDLPTWRVQALPTFARPHGGA